jgi:L,D-peptidoglycan transpeptidase YkuD (ErfK/YbiS/YcfS/YnhG family)
MMSVSLTCIPPTADAQRCPALLENASQLILVTLDPMNSSAAGMRLFERNDPIDVWRPVSRREPAVVGIRGAAWAEAFQYLASPGDPSKREGDNRTPAGIFAVGQPFGFSPSTLPDYLRIEPDTVCVDDPSSEIYNTITRLRQVDRRISVEHMRRGSLYRRGLVVDYPTNAAQRGGSCIFIHVWKSAITGTAGCIALPEARVAALQKFAVRPGSVLAVLPTRALGRLAHCLPPTTLDPQRPASAPSTLPPPR